MAPGGAGDRYSGLVCTDGRGRGGLGNVGRQARDLGLHLLIELPKEGRGRGWGLLVGRLQCAHGGQRLQEIHLFRRSNIGQQGGEVGAALRQEILGVGG